jgi:hypothetical protein
MDTFHWHSIFAQRIQQCSAILSALARDVDAFWAQGNEASRTNTYFPKPTSVVPPGGWCTDGVGHESASKDGDDAARNMVGLLEGMRSATLKDSESGNRVKVVESTEAAAPAPTHERADGGPETHFIWQRSNYETCQRRTSLSSQPGHTPISTKKERSKPWYIMEGERLANELDDELRCVGAFVLTFYSFMNDSSLPTSTTTFVDQILRKEETSIAT